MLLDWPYTRFDYSSYGDDNTPVYTYDPFNNPVTPYEISYDENNDHIVQTIFNPDGSAVYRFIDPATGDVVDVHVDKDGNITKSETSNIYDDDSDVELPPPDAESNIYDDDWVFDGDGDIFEDPFISPLIIDMDNDGVELTALSDSQTHFDLDGNGFAQRTGWVTGDDAFLAFDRNGDGKINDIHELFGNATIDGFTELSQLDTNSDGVMDANDAMFASLTLWQDRDGDGVTDDGELMSLADAGIVSIDLNAQELDEMNNGHDVSHRSSVTMTDGTQKQIDDIWFDNDRSDTQRVGSEGDVVADDVPYLRGLGQIADLQYAAAQDAGLHEQITSLIDDINNLSMTEVLQRFEEIVFRWAGVEDVPTDSRGPAIDGQHLAVLEAFKDQGYDQRSYYGSTPGPIAGVALENYYQSTLQTLAVRFLIQVPEVQAQQDAALAGDNPFAALSLLSPGFDTENNTLAVSETGLTLVVQLLASSASVEDVATLVHMLSHDVGKTPEQQAAFTSAVEQALTSAGVSEADAQTILDKLTFGNNTFINGTDQNDTLQGDADNNVLAGGRGNDTYIWGRGQGNDVTDKEGLNSDQDNIFELMAA